MTNAMRYKVASWNAHTKSPYALTVEGEPLTGTLFIHRSTGGAFAVSESYTGARVSIAEDETEAIAAALELASTPAFTYALANYLAQWGPVDSLPAYAIPTTRVIDA